ncbi:amidase family protein [Hyphomicrobiales bacterium BP6-180914]|uniref:Amidase family protein n=1 Tax=Lichenifustis flavocetrariae TaxID=2949735 RepID=A0AA41Z0Y0_9HYPH|nr:amidase family protein [Lichenifustis flavocetrariae]
MGVTPSYGLIATEGVFPLSWSLDHVGPLARSVADAAILLAGFTGAPLSWRERQLAGSASG